MTAVSVVMPAYNAAGSVGDAAKSILGQTEADLELIIVDDGSTDATPDVLRELAVDPRVRLERISHAGVVAANNHGAKLAEGRYIARMDADDWAYPQRIEQQRRFLDEHDKVGLTGCLIEFGGDRETHAGYAHYVDWTNQQITEQDISLARFIELPIPNPSIMYRRELIDSLGGYRDGDFPEDYEMLLRWMDAGVTMAKIPEVLLRWNDPPTRLSRNDDRYRYEAFFRTKAEFLANWLSRHNPFHPDILVWGASRTSRKRAEFLCDHGINIAGYVDVDRKKTGTPVHGRDRLYYTDIPGPDEVFVVSYVAKRGAREEISTMLEERDFKHGTHFVHSA